MEPINFKEATMTLTSPSSMPDTGDLPVYTDGKQCVSCWKPTWKERLSILVHGRIYLGVVGKRTQPPVWISGTCPFFRLSIVDHIRSFVNGIFLEEEKILHVIAGMIISIVTSGVMTIAWPIWKSAVLGLIIGLIAGVAKEIRDKFAKKGTPRISDFLCTAFGSVIGTLAFLAIGGLIFLVIQAVTCC